MNNREKAIRILEGSYKNFVLRHKGELITVNELLALLKAQEAAEPIVVPNDIYRSGGWWFQCPTCKMEIEPRDKYCKSCGQAVKWE